MDWTPWLESVPTFVATLLGVLIAFALERFAEWLGRLRTSRERRKELHSIRDALVSDVRLNCEAADELATMTAIDSRLASGRLRLEVWQAHRDRFHQLADREEDRTDIARFFESCADFNRLMEEFEATPLNQAGIEKRGLLKHRLFEAEDTIRALGRAIEHGP